MRDNKDLQFTVTEQEEAGKEEEEEEEEITAKQDLLKESTDVTTLSNSGSHSESNNLSVAITSDSVEVIHSDSSQNNI